VFKAKEEENKAQMVSTTIPKDYWEKGKDLGLGWNEYLRKGIDLIEQERLWKANLYEHIHKIMEKLNFYAQKCSDLTENLEKHKRLKIVENQAKKGVLGDNNGVLEEKR
jgi:hypothetical protein